MHSNARVLHVYALYARVFNWAKTTRDSGKNYTCPSGVAKADRRERTDFAAAGLRARRDDSVAAVDTTGDAILRSGR